MMIALLLVFFLFVASAALIRLLPRWLDRVAYAGPVSDHFDGERFFYPGGYRSKEAPIARGRLPVRTFARFMFGMDRTPWPDRVPVDQATPPARVDGDALHVTWVGHATVLIQTRGLNILTDPFWSERASPFPLLGPKRVRIPAVAFAALPAIDLVLVSHGHYDHLDLATLKRLWARDRPRIVTPLGHTALLRRHGIASEAHDWGERIAIAPDVGIAVDRVAHWTSRWGADRNRALWCGFTIVLPGGNLFFAGDTAMADGSWIDAAAARGPIRLALIPIGAYLPRAMMAGSHVDPAEAAAIFGRLGARYGLGIHWGTLRLSAEAIDDPPRDLAAALAAAGVEPGRFHTPEPGTEWGVPAL